MAVLVGIDEAGYGPILGPMVVSSTVFSIPDTHLKADLWQVLSKSLYNRKKHLAGRLLIADSKKAHNKTDGIKHLQRTTLAALRCLGGNSTTLIELLKQLCPDCLDRLETYPWYKTIHDHKLSYDKTDIEIASDVFGNDLTSNGMKLLGLRSICLDVGHFNKLVGAVKNKANVLFTATCRHIQNAWNRFAADEQLQVIVDRQGGRVRYRKNLQRMFDGLELTILKETPANSSYELRANGKKMRLHFTVGADERFLPVSLASMISKYVRELLVANINNYFLNRCSDLKPTAGYWKDGLRFIEEIRTNIPCVDYDSNQLIRCR